MKRVLICFLTAAAAFSGLAGIGYAIPDWSQETGFDFWNLLRLNRQLEFHRQLSDKLDARMEVSLSRVECKQRVVNQLAAGEVSLFEAAASFRNLARSAPEQLALIRTRYGDIPENEMFCRYVIEYVQITLAENEECRIIVDRLNAELERQLQKTNGVIQLVE